MNSFDLFWNNKRLAKSTQDAVLKFFAHTSKVTLQPKEPAFKESEAPFEIQSLALLRLNNKKHTAAVVLGSSQASFAKTFHELAQPQGQAPEAAAAYDPKKTERELLKAVFAAVDVELKAAQIAVDAASVIGVPGAQLGACWSKVSTKHSLQLPFSGPKGDFVVELPLIEEEVHRQKMIEHYGYNEMARILVVDDSATTRKVSRQLLATVGFINIDEAGDGQLAIAKLIGSRPPYDLVIADWHMPNLTGMDLLRKVRSHTELKALPVILATGERNKDEVVNAIKEGVSAYVVKPFDGETLYKAMKKSSLSPTMKKAA